MKIDNQSQRANQERYNMRAHFVGWIISLVVACVLTNITAPLLGHYKVPFYNWLTFGEFRYHAVDERGVPQVYYSDIKKKGNNAVYTSFYALMYYDLFHGSRENRYFLQYYYFEPDSMNSSPAENKEKFLNCADWLVKNLRLRNSHGISYGVWEYEFPWHHYEVSPPWISGMAQGVGLQALVRAYDLTKEKKYLSAAKLVLNSFLVEVEHGGVTYKNGDEWWYEEYAEPNAKKSLVLNGMQHAVIGIYEYHMAMRDSLSLSLFRKGILSLTRTMGRYDAEWWTYYDALNNISSVKYHNVHIVLNQKLYDCTGENEFRLYADRWKTYHTPFFVREFIKQRPSQSELIFLLLHVLGLITVVEVSLHWINKRKNIRSAV